MTEIRRFGLSANLLIQLAGSILLFGMMFALVDTVVTGWYADAITGSGDVAKGAGWMQYTWTFGPALLLTMVGIRIISRAIFESRGGVT